MTDQNPLDELASAHLDGVTTPVEAARVEADPELRARVETLRAVRAALQTEPPVDAERREHAIAAALAAYDEDGAIAPVTSLAEVAARRGASSRSLRVLGIAAAVALLAALVPIISSLSSSTSDDQTATAADERDTAGDSAGATDAESAPEVDSAIPPASTTTAAVGPTAADSGTVFFLGAFDDPQGAIDAARRASFGESVPRTTVAPDAPLPCLDVLLASLPPDATVLLTGTARVAGEAVAIVVTANEVTVAGGDCGSPISEPR